MANKEFITSYATNCEGKAFNSPETPLKDKPTPITITVFKVGSKYKREVGCGLLEKGKCTVSGDQPCIQLFPETSDVKLETPGKITSPLASRVFLDGAKLREARIAAGFTQRELALTSRSGPSVIGKLERNEGKTSPLRAALMAESLGVPLDDLLLDPKKAVTDSLPKKHGLKSRRRVG